MLKFAHDIAGGQGNLIVTSLQSPNFETGIEGWQVAKDGSAEFNNLVIRGTFNGTNFEISAAGIFFYSSTPANGNLLISIANVGGTDPFGNGYAKGIYFHGTSSSAVGMAVVGSVPIIDLVAPGKTHSTINGEIFPFTQNAGLVNEVAAVTVTSGKEGGDDAAIQLFSESADGTIPATAFIEFGGLIMAEITKAGTQLASAGGLTGFPVITQIDISNHSAASAANSPVTLAWTIPANDMSKGTTYRITSGGTGLWGTAQTLQTVGNLNGNNETGGGAAGRIAGAFLANATAFNWSAVYEFKVISTGTSGTARVRLTFTISSEGTALTPGTAAQNSMSVVTGPQAGAITVNTTIANTLGLGAAWGGTTGSPTIGSADSTFERLGP